jgi:hypothetical protein
VVAGNSHNNNSSKGSNNVTPSTFPQPGKIGGIEVSPQRKGGANDGEGSNGADVFIGHVLMSDDNEKNDTSSSSSADYGTDDSDLVSSLKRKIEDQEAVIQRWEEVNNKLVKKLGKK